MATMISLRSAVTKKALGYFFQNPRKSLYLNEIARNLRLDKRNLAKKVHELEKNGILVSAARGNLKLYSLNEKYFLLKELRNIFMKTAGRYAAHPAGKTGAAIARDAENLEPAPQQYGIGFYIPLLEALAHARVRFLVAGGVAVNLHGINRFTKDLDLVIHLDPENLRKAVGVFRQMGYKPMVPVPLEDIEDPEKRKVWMKEKNMIVFQLRNTFHPLARVDIFIGRESMSEDLFRRRKMVGRPGDQIPLVSAEDLIHMKQGADRLIDRLDISMLQRLRDEKK